MGIQEYFRHVRINVQKRYFLPAMEAVETARELALRPDANGKIYPPVPPPTGGCILVFIPVKPEDGQWDMAFVHPYAAADRSLGEYGKMTPAEFHTTVPDHVREELFRRANEKLNPIASCPVRIFSNVKDWVVPRKEYLDREENVLRTCAIPAKAIMYALLMIMHGDGQADISLSYPVTPEVGTEYGYSVHCSVNIPSLKTIPWGKLDEREVIRRIEQSGAALDYGEPKARETWKAMEKNSLPCMPEQAEFLRPWLEPDPNDRSLIPFRFEETTVSERKCDCGRDIVGRDGTGIALGDGTEFVAYRDTRAKDNEGEFVCGFCALERAHESGEFDPRQQPAVPGDCEGCAGIESCGERGCPLSNESE